MSKAPVIVLPKPCLKQALVPILCAEKKHAHFPPPSQEARRYSGIEYDRTPITVVANELALPARGCPGRTFDDADVHHYRHTLKKQSRSDPAKYSAADDVHPSHLASVAMSLNIKPSPSSLLTKSGSGPTQPLSTIYGDTSESDGDGTPPVSESDRELYLPGSGLVSGGSQTRRLRKATTAGRHRAPVAGWPRTNDLSPPSPTSTFASCPGSNSCLGGF